MKINGRKIINTPFNMLLKLKTDYIIKLMQDEVCFSSLVRMCVCIGEEIGNGE